MSRQPKGDAPAGKLPTVAARPGLLLPTVVVGVVVRKSGTVERHIQDDTPPGDPHPRIIVTEAPSDPCHREQDYEVVRAEFERRFAHQGALS